MADVQLEYRSVVDVFTADTTWYKPEGLAYVILVLTGGGGSGDTGNWRGGGGGGGALKSKPIPASLLTDVVQVIVGTGGAVGTADSYWIGDDGGDSFFGDDYRAPGGQGRDNGGIGGLSPLRGGNGAKGMDLGMVGDSVTALPVQLLCGGGGGSSNFANTWGGASGMNLRADGTTTSNAPLMWPGVHQAGHGGSGSKQPPQWPAGGGGTSQPGAAGSVAVIQVIANINDIT